TFSISCLKSASHRRSRSSMAAAWWSSTRLTCWLTRWRCCCRPCGTCWPRTRRHSPRQAGSARPGDLALQARETQEKAANAVRSVGLVSVEARQQAVALLGDEDLRECEFHA